MSIKVDSFKVRRDFALVTFDRHGSCYGGLVHIKAAEEYNLEAAMTMITQLYGDLPWLPFIKGERVEEIVPRLDAILSGILAGDDNYHKWEGDMHGITLSFCSGYAANSRNMIEHYSYMNQHEDSKPYYTDAI
jgi:hypothetical protein